jgi:hypothetical protein
MFDAWAAYDRWAVGTRLRGSLRRPARERTPANKREAVSYAAFRALVDLFPARADDFTAGLRAARPVEPDRLLGLQARPPQPGR